MKILLHTYRKLFILITILSALSLSAAYIVEYVMNIKPCRLCIYQRIPYFIITGLGVMGLLLNKNSLSKYICYVCSLVFLSGSIIALYHTGIERGAIEEPNSCAVNFSQDHSSIESLKHSIQQNTVPCKEVKMRIAGLSIAEINALFSFAMFIYILLSARKMENKAVKLRESLERMGIDRDSL
ncbi:MAG: disulfide bond formation protein B [Alphaproteobacteria bacterium]|nr:disulfide bond formation protein B [Alphaproteobacteria bacterium]